MLKARRQIKFYKEEGDKRLKKIIKVAQIDTYDIVKNLKKSSFFY